MNYVYTASASLCAMLSLCLPRKCSVFNLAHLPEPSVKARQSQVPSPPGSACTSQKLLKCPLHPKYTTQTSGYIFSFPLNEIQTLNNICARYGDAFQCCARVFTWWFVWKIQPMSNMQIHINGWGWGVSVYLYLYIYSYLFCVACCTWYARRAHFETPTNRQEFGADDASGVWTRYWLCWYVSNGLNWHRIPIIWFIHISHIEW